MLSKFLDPKNDIAFRRIFGSERNKDILIHFINDILVFKEQSPIVHVSFLKTSQDPEIAHKKTSIVDVLCEDEYKNQYIVEMQVAKETGFEKRAQYYASKAYASQINAGGEYENLKEIVFIAIANFTMFPNKTHFKSDHIILDKDSYEHDLKDFSFTFLELPKFKKKIHTLNNIVDKWMYFFKHANKESPQEIEKMIGGDAIMERAYHELDRHYWNEIELRTYEQSQKYEWGYQSSMRQAKREGIEEGVEKGIEIGTEKGAKQKAHEIASLLLKQGVPIQLIMQVTGLKEEEINP